MQNLLSDLVVVDLTRALAGPQAAMMLGDLGARVIKVETPAGGDDSRGWGPPFVGEESTYFLSANRNKESVTADLKSAEGKEFLTKLVRQGRRTGGELPAGSAGPARVLRSSGCTS